jgi:hypothetical protein
MKENPQQEIPGDLAVPAAAPNIISDEKREALAEMFVGVAPAILRGRIAFLRDLPELLKNPKYDRWCVAYAGDEQIALLPFKKDVVRECLKRGLQDGEYFFGMVVPYDDEDNEIDQSLYEFDQPIAKPVC